MIDNILTVLLSTYNHIDTFKQAIESVLSQKTNFDFEIWVLDDASNDGTTDIVKEYAKKYPKKIIPFIQEKNTKGRTTLEKIKDIRTKYYTILETDDYWCDDNKLQMQIDILEKNPDCSMCAHNTIRNYVEQKKQEKYLDSPEKKYTLPGKKLTHKYYIEPHTSSRIYRTSCIDWNEVENTNIIVYDVPSAFYFLTKGNLYYIDKVMSVYNYTGCGIFSSSTSYQNRYKAAYGIYILNRQLKYKYNYLLARFFSTRLNLNFILSYKLKSCKDTKKLEALYSKILTKFKEENLKIIDKKPILSYKIPISTNKKLCVEISREKELC